MKYCITDFGASVSDCLQTEYIQRAIDTCFLNGGGEVVVPAGIYRTGGIRLRSNVTFHLLSGAVLEASENPADYDVIEKDTLEPIKAEDFDASIRSSAAPLSAWQHAIIRAVHAENIAVIAEPYAFIDGKNCYDPNGEENYRGPHGINLWNCKNVTFRGYTIRNTGNWAHAIFQSEQIQMENVTVYGGHDAFDIFLCKNVTVCNCEFYTGDDCIAGFGSEQVLIQDCILNTACSAIRFGGKDVVIERCITEAPAKFAFRGGMTKEQKEKGAMPDKNARRNTKTAFLYYCDGRFGNTPIPRMGNILIRDCRFEGVDQLFNMDFGKHIWCCHRPLTSITFENCTLTGAALPIYIYGDPNDPIDFGLKNAKVSPAAGKEELPVLDGEHFASIHFENVSWDGYYAPELVVRSEGKVEVEAVKILRGESGKAGYSGH